MSGNPADHAIKIGITGDGDVVVQCPIDEDGRFFIVTLTPEEAHAIGCWLISHAETAAALKTIPAALAGDVMGSA